MHRACFVVLLLGCSDPRDPNTSATDSGTAGDSASDVVQDVQSIPFDMGASCGHDLCLNFDDGRITPIDSVPVTNGGGTLALDSVARSNPNSLRAATPDSTGSLAVARIEPQVQGGRGNARMKFAMRLDPITFASTHPGFIRLATMHLDDVQRTIELELDKDGLHVKAWFYAGSLDAGVTTPTELPKKTLTTMPAFGTWTDVELRSTPAGDGARVVVTVGSESVTIDMPASGSDPVRSNRFELGVTSFGAPPATARFDDLTLDTES